MKSGKKLGNLAKKAEIFGTLVGVMNGEKPYFHVEYLIDNVFKLTPEEKAENQKYWAKDATGAPGGGEAAPGGEVGGPDMGGEMPEMGTQMGEGGPSEGPEGAPAPAQGGAQAAPEAPPTEGGSEFEF